ncbi:15884_t:CDS:2, partial [Racocetra persica]
GPIGVEKTIFGKILSKYLEARGSTVFYPKEASIKVFKELELVYETDEKDVDYVILDCSSLEINIFSNTNIENEKLRKYFEKKYLKSILKITMKQKIFKKNYDQYEQDFNDIYPEHILFENTFNLCEKCCKKKKYSKASCEFSNSKVLKKLI